jgi:hypothetical protein
MCFVIDVSIEQVAALSSQSTLPEPTLDLTRLQPSMSTIPTTRKPNASPLRATLPSYSSEDPWNSNARFTGLPSNATDTLPNGTPSTVAGSGLPKDWWKKQENIRVTILGQQGFILNRYMVYEISIEVSYTSLGLQASFLLIDAFISVGEKPCDASIFGVRCTLGLSCPTISIPPFPCITSQTSRR